MRAGNIREKYTKRSRSMRRKADSPSGSSLRRDDIIYSKQLSECDAQIMIDVRGPWGLRHFLYIGIHKYGREHVVLRHSQRIAADV
jgi:hypothetical protein